MKRALQLFTVMAFVFALSFSAWADAYLITSASDPALAGGEVITFDSAPTGTYYNFTSGGVVFQSLDDMPFRISADYSGQYNNPGLAIENGTYETGFTARMKFSGVGGGTTNAFGFNWGASNTTWKLSAYNAAGALIASFDLPITGSSNAGDFVGIAAEGISYAILEGDSGDWVFIDNFTSGEGSAAAVPEPATMLLLGIGLVGAAAMRKRLHK
jgi:hypothetical protein